MLTEQTKSKMNREQWILVKTMSSAVMTLNAVFCDEMDAEGLKTIAEGIAEDCSSTMALEDALEILNQALSIRIANQEQK